MNRLIILDNLRQGYPSLFFLGCLYLFGLVPVTDFVWNEMSPTIAALLFGFFATVFCFLLWPNREITKDPLGLDALLPVPRGELISTQWFMRTVFPAAFLAILLATAGPLGLNEHVLSSMPDFLPAHLFFAYLGGLSLVFYCLSGAMGRSYTWIAMALLLGLIFPFAYFLAFSRLQEFLAWPFMPMLLTSLFAAILYRKASVSLASDRGSGSVGSTRTSWRWNSGGWVAGGFTRLAASSLAMSLVGTLILVVVLLSMDAWLNPADNRAADDGILLKSAVFSIPLLCFLTYNYFFQNFSLVAPIRILRLLPLSPGGLALRIYGITAGMHMLSFVALSLAAMSYFNPKYGLFLLDTCFVWTAVLSPLAPLALRYRGLARHALSFAYFLVMLFTLQVFLRQHFMDVSPLANLFVHLIAIVLLVASWWLLKRTLTHSSATYRVELS